MDNSLQELWFVLEDAGELTSCENLNGQYQAAVYDDLCEDVPDGLLGFWVSCAILTVLLLVLVSLVHLLYIHTVLYVASEGWRRLMLRALCGDPRRAVEQSWPKP